MNHPDPDLLALRSLGERIPEVDAHVASCRTCSQTLDGWRDVALIARCGEVTDEELFALPTLEPPADVWTAITAATRKPSTAAAQRSGVATIEQPDAAARGAQNRAAASATTPAESSRPPTSLAARRDERERTTGRARFGRQFWAVAASLLVGLLGGAGILSAWQANNHARDTASPTVRTVASAQLAPLTASNASGTATMVEEQGGYVLRVTAQLPAAGTGYFEVWLADREAKKMIPLGVLSSSTGSFPVPASVDLAEYTVVDISAEPMDGDPGHSADSVLRGAM